MKFSKIFYAALLALLALNISCRDDDPIVIVEPSKGAYENGVFVVNEGSYNSSNASVSFINGGETSIQNNIFKTNNNDATLGDVLQDLGLNGDLAYLVVNNSNKIEIVNRYTFKKQAVVTTNLNNPRYIAFSGSQYFVTNNNFFDVRKLNIYNTSTNAFVSSIDFPRAAEKVVEANGRIVVQTDGIGYQSVPPFTAFPTGYSLAIVNPSTNAIATTLTLPSNGIIRDLISYNGNAYVLASSDTDSYIYKINATAETFTTTTITGLGQTQKLRIDANKFYFNDNSNKIYAMDLNSTASPTNPIVTTTGTLYGFNVIDGKIYTSDASFTGDSKVNIYSANNGTLLKTFNSGVATNGFYKN